MVSTATPAPIFDIRYTTTQPQDKRPFATIRSATVRDIARLVRYHLKAPSEKPVFGEASYEARQFLFRASAASACSTVTTGCM